MTPVRVRSHRRRRPGRGREARSEGFIASTRRYRLRQILEAQLAAATDERERRKLQADLDLVTLGSTGTVQRIMEAFIADRENEQ